MLAHFGKEGVPEAVIPKISQETLAEMIGTTRWRVSFFMNRFRKLVFVASLTTMAGAGRKSTAHFSTSFSTTRRPRPREGGHLNTRSRVPQSAALFWVRDETTNERYCSDAIPQTEYRTVTSISL